MSSDRMYRSSLGWKRALLALVAVGCGTHAGTESGNPIGPPPPEELVEVPVVEPPLQTEVMPPTTVTPVAVPEAEPPAIELEPPAVVVVGPQAPESPMEDPAPAMPPAPPVAVEVPMTVAGDPPQEMCEPDACSNQADATATALGMPQTSPSVSDGVCETQPGGASACVCGSGAGAVTVVARDPALPSACLVSGRLGDECLLTDDGIETCTLEAPDCSSVCGGVDEQTKVRNAQTYDAQVVSSGCEQSSECVFVIQVGETCYRGEELAVTECPTPR